jgi:hypothetical protein
MNEIAQRIYGIHILAIPPMSPGRFGIVNCGNMMMPNLMLGYYAMKSVPEGRCQIFRISSQYSTGTVRTLLIGRFVRSCVPVVPVVGSHTNAALVALGKKRVS